MATVASPEGNSKYALNYTNQTTPFCTNRASLQRSWLGSFAW